MKGAPSILFREAAQAVVTMYMLVALQFVLIATRTTSSPKIADPSILAGKDNQHVSLRVTKIQTRPQT